MAPSLVLFSVWTLAVLAGPGVMGAQCQCPAGGPPASVGAPAAVAAAAGTGTGTTTGYGGSSNGNSPAAAPAAAPAVAGSGAATGYGSSSTGNSPASPASVPGSAPAAAGMGMTTGYGSSSTGNSPASAPAAAGSGAATGYGSSAGSSAGTPAAAPAAAPAGTGTGAATNGTVMPKGYPATSPTYKVIPIVVGSPNEEKSLVFYPDSVVAAPGDILQFQFQLSNHTVTQAAGPESPCAPLQEMMPTALHSGFIPGPQADSTSVGAFIVPVLDTKPMYLYCARGPHCNLGMVMVVNPATANDLTAYRAAAMKVKTNVPAKNIMGGAQVRIPVANAVPPTV